MNKGAERPPVSGAPSSEDAQSSSRALFEQTGNPVYIWREILVCLSPPDRQSRRPLPDYCLDYLASCADGISRLAELRDPRTLEPRRAGETTAAYEARIAAWRQGARITPSDAADLVPFVFGLAIKGRRRVGAPVRARNRLEDASHNVQQVLDATLVRMLRRPAGSRDAAITAIMKARSVERRQANNRVKEGRTLLGTILNGTPKPER